MERFKIQELGKNEDFDVSVLCKDVPFTQARFYGRWQKELCREVKRFVIKTPDEVVGYFQLIRYPFFFGRSFIYIPYGPVLKNPDDNLLCFLKRELKKVAKSERAFFVRLDFTPPLKEKTLSKFFKKSPLHTRHASYTQPRTEWFVDLTEGESEEELLLLLPGKTRYLIRHSVKKEITTEVITENFPEYFEVFYKLMSETSSRNNFSLHPKKYYENIFNQLNKDHSFLVLGKYGEKTLVITLVVTYGDTATFVFGASESEEKSRNPTYATHWRGICEAKKQGYQYYNFGGISSQEKKGSQLDGVSTFKKKFKGHRHTHSDFYDLVTGSFYYRLYTLQKLLKSAFK